MDTFNKDYKVKLNYGNEFYQLQYNWPKNTYFNLNGFFRNENISSEMSLEDYLEREINYYGVKHINECLEVYLETYKNPIYIEIFLPDIFIATHGQSFKECEDKLWDKYNNYLNCEHEWTKEHPTQGHYSNGVGYCPKCKVTKSDIFQKETNCSSCGNPADLLPTFDENKKVCFDCYKNLAYINKINLNWLSDKYIIKQLEEDCLCEDDDTNNNISNKTINKIFSEYELKYTINNNDNEEKTEIIFSLSKECEGIYLITNFQFKGKIKFLTHIVFNSNIQLTNKYYIVEEYQKDILSQRLLQINKKLNYLLKKYNKDNTDINKIKESSIYMQATYLEEEKTHIENLLNI